MCKVRGVSVYILLMCWLTPLTRGQPSATCEPWIESPGYCMDLFTDSSYQVYVVPGVAEQVSSEASVVALLDQFLPPASRFCGEQMIKFICQNFRKCKWIELEAGVMVAVEARPCYSSCAVFLDSCHEVFDAIGLGALLRSQIANCSAVDSSGNALYPDEFTDYPIGEGRVERVECVSYVGVAVDYEVDCPDPWVFSEEAYEKGDEQVCQAPCLSLVYTEEEWDSLLLMGAILATISFFSSLVVLITLYLLPRYRVYPGRAVTFQMVCTFQISVGSFVVFIHGAEDVWCKNEYTKADMDDSFCTWQGIWLQYWWIASIFWWGVIAYNMAHLLVIKKAFTLKVEATAHTICWGVPFVMLVLALIFPGFGYSDTAYFCGMLFDDLGWFYGLLLVPVAVTVLFTLVSVLFVMWEMRNAAGRYRVYRYYRVILFLSFFMYFNVYFIAVFGYGQDREEDLTVGTVSYAGCLLYGFGKKFCWQFVSRLSYSAWMTAAFNAIGGVTIVSLIWGTTPDVLWFWCRVARNAHLGRPLLHATSTHSDDETSWISHSSPDSSIGSSVSMATFLSS